MPESFPYTREEAIKYIETKFRYYNRTEDDGELLYSLPAEPLVLFYGESQLESKVILAIGRSGDGKDASYNMPYYLIDFTRLEEDLSALTEKVEGLGEILDQVYADLEACKADIQVCKEDIEALKKLIGEKGDNPAKDTVYGYIEGAYDAIKEEENRATIKETLLETDIKANATLIEALTSNLDQETKNRIEEDDDLRAMINEEKSRAQGVEETISETLSSEINRSIAEDLAIKGSIADLQEKDVALELADKQNKVVSANKTIIVGAPTENGTDVAVNLDYKTLVVNEGGVIAVSAEALDLKINENDKVLTDDVNGLIATLSLKWVHANAEGEKDEIQLIGKNDTVISRIDVADFIKDGMLQSVELTRDEEGNPVAFKFTFNVDAEKDEPVIIPIKDLIDVYEAGNGLDLTANVFSLVLDQSGDGFLTLSSQGLKIVGVKEAIATAVAEEKSRATLVEQGLVDRITVNETALNTLNGSVGTEGSVKSMVYNAALGSVVTTITPEQAGEQSLIKKAVIDGTSYFYASNSTADMKHGNENLNTVIETIKSDVAENTEKIENTENKLAELVAQYNNLVTNYNTLLASHNKLAERLTALENNPVSLVGTANEIAVTKDPNSSATYKIGFAPNAYFVAGETIDEA